MKLCLTTIPSATGANSYFTEGKNTDGPLWDVTATFLSPAPKEKGTKMKKRRNTEKSVFGFIKTPEINPAKCKKIK
jgi:hypothetical protein